MLGKGKFVD